MQNPNDQGEYKSRRPDPEDVKKAQAEMAEQAKQAAAERESKSEKDAKK